MGQSAGLVGQHFLDLDVRERQQRALQLPSQVHHQTYTGAKRQRRKKQREKKYAAKIVGCIRLLEDVGIDDPVDWTVCKKKKKKPFIIRPQIQSIMNNNTFHIGG